MLLEKYFAMCEAKTLTGLETVEPGGHREIGRPLGVRGTDLFGDRPVALIIWRRCTPQQVERPLERRLASVAEICAEVPRLHDAGPSACDDEMVPA
jgi:hypothetical protein